jgi:hypothetical protein
MRRFPRELLIALFIATVHGLLYVFIVPPWEHYDEPAHAEYAWLIANKTPRPTEADVDRDMRFMFVRSMADSGFYADRGSMPAFDLAGPTPSIGYSQLGDRPTYYWLAAVPMMILRDQPIETQLRGARMVSLLLLLITVTCAWGVSITVSPPQILVPLDEKRVLRIGEAGHPLRWLVPCGAALLPAFVDLMTAVNNDAGAIAMFSLFLWGSMRLLKKRSWINALWVALSAIAAAAMKSTALFALPLGVLVFVLAFVPGRLRWAAFAAMPLLALIGMLVVFAGGDPAFWYRNASQDTPMRCDGLACGGQLSAGQHAFTLAPAAESIQLIPQEEVARLQGRPATLGAWLWSEVTQTVQMPALRFTFYGQPDAPVLATQAVTIGPQPTWHSYKMDVPAGVKYGVVTLQPGHASGTVFMDELVLVAGDQTLDTPANLAAMPNAIRNGSAEQGWPWLRPWAHARITNLFSDPLRYNYLLSPLDPAGAGHYYALSAQLLFETFWARFSWAQVAAPPAVFTLLALFTAGSIALTLLMWPRWRRWLRLDHAVVLSLALLALWALTFMRGTPLLDVLTFLNVARYTYPAIIPALVLLLLGWSELAVMLADKPRAMRALKVAGVAAPAVLAVISLLTVGLFFAG